MDNPKQRRLKQAEINRKEYDRLWEEQDGFCLICEQSVEGLIYSKGGLICTNCNAGLDFFHEDADLLRLAIQYLEK